MSSQRRGCATALHRDIGNTAAYVTNLAALSACTDDFQCGPNSAECLNAGSDGFVCRNNLLSNTDPCGANEACLSGRCELANDAALESTCVPGAGASQACDSVAGDGGAQSCAPGLLCFGETAELASGTCVTQAAPGTNCEDPDGDPNGNRCGNGSACEDVWNEGDICTDAAIPPANGGTGLICDGNDS